jgi:N-acetylglutamate synthase-like GNAT family acetyltransferase
MDIREASSGDIPLLAALIRDSFRDVAVRFALTPENCPTHPSCCDEEWVEAAMGKGTRFFLLEDGESACGCAALEQAGPDVCYLERLAVLPAQRHKGHGKSLVGHVLEEARGAGVERVDIGIIAAQTELRDWYLGLGFAETEKKRFEHLPFEVAFMSYGI